MALKDQIIKVLAEDLGPSAEAFYIRQCKSHLNKDPDQITKQDIDELAKWCRIGVNLILGAEIAEKVMQKIIKCKTR